MVVDQLIEGEVEPALLPCHQIGQEIEHLHLTANLLLCQIVNPLRDQIVNLLRDRTANLRQYRTVNLHQRQRGNPPAIPLLHQGQVQWVVEVVQWVAVEPEVVEEEEYVRNNQNDL